MRKAAWARAAVLTTMPPTTPSTRASRVSSDGRPCAFESAEVARRRLLAPMCLRAAPSQSQVRPRDPRAAEERRPMSRHPLSFALVLGVAAALLTACGQAEDDGFADGEEGGDRTARLVQQPWADLIVENEIAKQVLDKLAP